MKPIQVLITREQHKKLRQAALNQDSTIADLMRNWVEKTIKGIK